LRVEFTGSAPSKRAVRKVRKSGKNFHPNALRRSSAISLKLGGVDRYRPSPPQHRLPCRVRRLDLALIPLAGREHYAPRRWLAAIVSELPQEEPVMPIVPKGEKHSADLRCGGHGRETRNWRNKRITSGASGRIRSWMAGGKPRASKLDTTQKRAISRASGYGSLERKG
jgi:hypothetical protein